MRELLAQALTICSRSLKSLSAGLRELDSKLDHYIKIISPKKLKEKDNMDYSAYIGKNVAQIFHNNSKEGIRYYGAKVVDVHAPGKLVVQYNITANGNENIREVFDLTQLRISTIGDR